MKRLALLFLFASCGHTPTPPPKPVGDATCESACTHMQALGCEAGKPTPRGTPCVDVCENIMTSGIVTYRLDCMSEAPNCTAVDDCNP